MINNDHELKTLCLFIMFLDNIDFHSRKEHYSRCICISTNDDGYATLVIVRPNTILLAFALFHPKYKE